MRDAQSSMRTKSTGFRSATQRHSVPDIRNPYDMETIGDRIRQLRERRGIEAADLARAAKLAYSTLMDLENGRSKSTTKLPALIRELRTNARYLETGKGDPDDTAAPDLAVIYGKGDSMPCAD
jgi:ribosome-binding protein aMBF1 (putative translation factor)